MGVKKQKPKDPARSRFNWRDERLPKIAGVILILAAIYLAIAFVSYLYTWKMDQDKVLKFSWGMLIQGDLSVQNWLGRLGAIISNMFLNIGLQNIELLENARLESDIVLFAMFFSKNIHRMSRDRMIQFFEEPDWAEVEIFIKKYNKKRA